MAKYFSSDLHFFHKNVITYCNRPWDNVEDMNEGLITIHNSVVKPEDTWYFLGDFAFGSNTKIKEVISRLNGKKIAVCGNHDRGAKKMMELGFDFACHELVLNVGKHRCRLSHFPYRPTDDEIANLGYDARCLDRRPPRVEGEFLLHGHSHSSKDKVLKRNSLDIGVDGHDYKPWSESEVVGMINASRSL